MILAKERVVGILVIHWEVNLRETVFKFKERKIGLSTFERN